MALSMENFTRNLKSQNITKREKSNKMLPSEFFGQYTQENKKVKSNK